LWQTKISYNKCLPIPIVPRFGAKGKWKGKKMINNPSDIPLMLGVKEIAERFGIAQHYARQLALSGKVKAVRVGRGKILINAQSVAEYFDSSYIHSESTENMPIIT